MPFNCAPICTKDSYVIFVASAVLLIFADFGQKTASHAQNRCIKKLTSICGLCYPDEPLLIPFGGRACSHWPVGETQARSCGGLPSVAQFYHAGQGCARSSPPPRAPGHRPGALCLGVSAGREIGLNRISRHVAGTGRSAISRSTCKSMKRTFSIHSVLTHRLHFSV
jgi:hypothetical protein